jgi:hypothetical protein
MIAHIPSNPANSTGSARLLPVTLPPAPFPVPADDRADTAPRSLPVIADRHWRKDSLIRWADMCAT